MAATSEASVASHVCVVMWALASPARSSVSRTASAFLSTANTVAPSWANNTAVARPLPQPGPTEPAPVTIATLPASRSAMMCRARRQFGLIPAACTTLPHLSISLLM